MIRCYCEIAIRRLEQYRRCGKLGWQNGHPFEKELPESLDNIEQDDIVRCIDCNDSRICFLGIFAMKIVVIGTGYVGLVTGTCLAETGNNVVCVDCDRKKIDILNRGHIPIYEPGLAELVARNVSAGRLHFTTDLAAAAAKARMVFLAVGTPPSDDGSVDLTALWAVVDGIAAAHEQILHRGLQEHGAGGHQRENRRPVERAYRPRDGRGQQSRVPQGRDGHRGFHEARPRGHRRPPGRSRRSAQRTCTSRICAPKSRCWSCRPKAPK